MEHTSDTYRLTGPGETDAALMALASYEASRTPHISDADKAQAQHLRAALIERAPTPELSEQDIIFLAGASKYMLGSAHHVAETYRQSAFPIVLRAAQTIADVNKPLTAK